MMRPYRAAVYARRPGKPAGCPFPGIQLEPETQRTGKSKTGLRTIQFRKTWSFSEKEERDILDLDQKIPEIWNAPTSMPKEKKRIIHILVDDITILAEKRRPIFSIGIRFRSGK